MDVPPPTPPQTLGTAIQLLHEPAEVNKLAQPRVLTRLLYALWMSREDLRSCFDITQAQDQDRFLAWFASAALPEYGVPAQFASTSGTRQFDQFFALKRQVLPLVERLVAILPGKIRRNIRKAALKACDALSARGGKVSSAETRTYLPPAGANLIGYAQGVLGMGEHVRMTAHAMAETDIRFGIFNFTLGVKRRQAKPTEEQAYLKRNEYGINVFHINADQMIPAYFELGPSFFEQRYNIGYWAWELSKWPDAWIPVTDCMDEIWAPSRFIQQSISAATNVPVVLMPLCVELPVFPTRSKAFFDIPQDKFTFLMTFDFLSFVERKNPRATIKAFKLAFPKGTEPVALIIKVMNLRLEDRKWQCIAEDIIEDSRIKVISSTLERGDMLALLACCDAYVSLHRSEGFGRGPAEAMLMGKPTIVTGYSGNTDFTLPDNSCLVDYNLVDVEAGDYVMSGNQQWADPDVDHAASHIRRLVTDSAFSSDLGRRAQKFMQTNYSAVAIGAQYAQRLREISRQQRY